MSSATLSPTSMQRLEARIAPLRERLTRHPLYASLHTEADLRLFLQSHVFAVWDFMSLLKALQAQLTCVTVPWVPTPFPESRRFINEIVFGEESDEYQGRPASHFELYLEAMTSCGADTGPIRALLARIAQQPGSLGFSLHGVPAAAHAFVDSTFAVIRSGSLPAMAAAFTFGREDVIPDMFRELVRDLNQRGGGAYTQLVWYFERHIEVDGDEHGPLSLRMVADLCGDKPTLWQQASDAAVRAMEARLALWDGILAEVQSERTPA